MRKLQAIVSFAVLPLAVGLITSTTVFAQTGAGSVTGIITDQSGATVPGATVTATNQATNLAYSAVVNEAGNYTVTSLPQGRLGGNGNREQTNNYTIDGVDMNETIDNLVAYQPSPDALAEISVETNNYSDKEGAK